MTDPTRPSELELQLERMLPITKDEWRRLHVMLDIAPAKLAAVGDSYGSPFQRGISHREHELLLSFAKPVPVTYVPKGSNAQPIRGWTVSYIRLSSDGVDLLARQETPDGRWLALTLDQITHVEQAFA